MCTNFFHLGLKLCSSWVNIFWPQNCWVIAMNTKQQRLISHPTSKNNVWGGGVEGVVPKSTRLKSIDHPLFHRRLRSFWQIWSRELVERIIMLSLLMLLLAIMTTVTATGDNKQSAQTTVSSYRKPYVNLLGNIQGRSLRFCRCTHEGEKIFSVEAGPT